MNAGTVRPLVITLAVDEGTDERWNALRSRWFPADRLVVGAHLTLFHALPGERVEDVLADVAEVASAFAPFPVEEEAFYSLGSGVALRIGSARLTAVRAELAGRWAGLLTRQDGQPFRPHVTVQNKVGRETATETLALLRATAAPRPGTAVGIAVWRYEGGPWAPVRLAPFTGPDVSGGIGLTPDFLRREL